MVCSKIDTIYLLPPKSLHTATLLHIVDYEELTVEAFKIKAKHSKHIGNKSFSEESFEE